MASLVACGRGGEGGGDGDVPTPVATASVTGTILDGRGAPIADARVVIASDPVTVTTDGLGFFTVQVEPGSHTLTADKGVYLVTELTFAVPDAAPVDLGFIESTADYYPWYADADGDDFGDFATIVSQFDQPLGHVLDHSDCDDTSDTVHPAAVEICNGIDENCDQEIDEGFDADADGYKTCDGDCDDTVASIHPGASEVCNALDDDCDAEIDEGVLATFYRDADADLYGDALDTTNACVAPEGYVADNTDCDDGAATVHPGAIEQCNGIDDDCEGGIDEGLLATYYLDFDSDLYGDFLTPTEACSLPANYVANGLDCDDMDPAVNPDAIEVCNTIDDNCDTLVDEGLTTTYFFDADHDTYGNPQAWQDACASPLGYVSNDLDCDDADADINPTTVWYPDGDADQWPSESGPLTQCAPPSSTSLAGHLVAQFDCDDTTADRSPGNIEIQENLIDDDCNPSTSDDLTVYGLADLEGTWSIFGINAGDFAAGQWNGWMEGFISFDASGEYQDFRLVYDDGVVETAPSFTQFWVNPDGILTAIDTPVFHGVLSQDKDTIVATFTDPEGGYSMLILLKSASASAISEFEGLWHNDMLVAGDDPEWSGWVRGTLAYDNDGQLTFDFRDSAGNAEAGTGSVDLSSGGAAEDPEFTHMRSLDSQMIVGRGTYRGGFALSTLIQAGGAFLPSNIQGDWSFHVLSAGDAPEVNGWGHGMLNFDDQGEGLVNFQNVSASGNEIDLGTLSVDGDGSILSSAIPDFEGHLSKNKDTFTSAFTNASGGASWLIALRRDAPFLGIVSEEHNSVSATIGSAGGTLETWSDAGVHYRLVIPPGAFADDEATVDVKMTPVAALDGLPVSGDLKGAVTLSPERLQLLIPVFLIVTVPEVLAPEDCLAFVSHSASRDSFNFQPSLEGCIPATGSASSLLTSFGQFSTAGMATGNASDMSGLAIDPARSSEAARASYRNRAAGVLQAMREAGFSSLKDPAAEGLRDMMNRTLSDWFQQYIYPNLLAAFTLEELKRAVLEYLQWVAYIQQLAASEGLYCVVDIFGFCDPDVDLVSPNASTLAENAVDATIDAKLEDLDQSCLDATRITDCSSGPLCEVTITTLCAGLPYFLNATPWIGFQTYIAQTYFYNIDPMEFADFCSGIGTQLPKFVYVQPEYEEIEVGEAASFSGVYRTFLGGELGLVSDWTSPRPDIAAIASDGSVVGRDLGSTEITGWGGEGQCLGDDSVVSVGSPFQGTWTTKVYKRTNETCDVPPSQANPPSIHFNAFGNQLTWTDFNPPHFYFVMTGTSTGLSATVTGGVTEMMSQSCDIKILPDSEMVGDCSYRLIEGGSRVCKGDWRFSGFRLDPPAP